VIHRGNVPVPLSPSVVIPRYPHYCPSPFLSVRSGVATEDGRTAVPNEDQRSRLGTSECPPTSSRTHPSCLHDRGCAVPSRVIIAGHRRESSSAATLPPTSFVSATVLSLCLSEGEPATRKAKPPRAKRKLKTTTTTTTTTTTAAPRARIQRLNFISQTSTGFSNPQPPPRLYRRRVSARCSAGIIFGDSPMEHPV